MKAEILEWVVCLVAGGLFAAGAMAVFGPGPVSWVVMIGVFAAFLWFGKRTSDEYSKTYADAQRRLCEERTLRYDAMVDQGVIVNYNGKPWVKSSRIDPATNAMIEPGV